jgi:oxygen-independent coproporphyrinogen-3 oxidase
MLRSVNAQYEAIRFSTPDSLERYVANAPLAHTEVSWQQALEETFFLGLRLNEGIHLEQVAARFGEAIVNAMASPIAELETAGLLDRQHGQIRLTSRGRLLSNEVFERFLSCEDTGVSAVRVAAASPPGSGQAPRRPTA